MFNGEKDSANSHNFVSAYVEFYKQLKGASDEDTKKEDFVVESMAHMLEFIYRNLDTLDQKASSLLTYCGLVIAATTFLFQYAQTELQLLLLKVAFIMSGFSAIGALYVIDVHWTSPSELKTRTLQSACVQYHLTRSRRTSVYLLSRWIIFAITVFCILYMVFYAIPNAPLHGKLGANASQQNDQKVEQNQLQMKGNQKH